MTCCHAVSALRSSVASPVPVIALTQQKSRSTYRAGNLPLHACAIAASTSGVTVLGAATATATSAAREREMRERASEQERGGDGDAQEEQVQAIKVNVELLELLREPARRRPRANAQRPEACPQTVHLIVVVLR